MGSVTLREIAEKVGCTRSTVSYALKNYACISPATRKKVQKAARELGWRPNAPLASHMALVRATALTQKLPNLAIIINKPDQDLAREPSSRWHLEGARRRAQQLGFEPDIFNLAKAPLSPGRLRQVLEARGVQGLVYIATYGSVLSPEVLDLGRHFASSVAGVRYITPGFHCSINDFFSAGQTAVLELARLGFRRPGTVMAEQLDRELGRMFYGGVQAGMLDATSIKPVPVCLVGKDPKGLQEMPTEFLRQILDWLEKNEPDVLLTTDPRNVKRCLDLMGGSARDLPIYTLDWHPEQAVAGGIDGLPLSVGATAVDLTVAQIHRGESGIPAIQQVVLIEGVWNVGPTRKKPRAGRTGSPFAVPAR